MALNGLTRTCGQNKGGIKRFYATEAANVTSMTKGSGVESYASITMATGTVFKEYVFEEDTGAFKPVVEANKGAYKVTTAIDIDLGKMDQDEADAVQNLLDNNNCGFIIIVELNSGAKFVVGYNETDVKTRPARITAINGDSKLEFMDPNSDVVTFTQVGSERPRTYTGSVPTT